MNIFLLPSWYPSKHNALAGSFTKEQAMMIAQEYESEVNYFVSVNNPCHLTPRHIKQSIKNFINCKNNEKEVKKVLNNYIEYHWKSFLWTTKIFNGNFNNLLKNHRDTLENLLDSGVTIDVIHSHVSYPAGYIAYLLAKEFDIAYVITEHMGPFPFEGYLKNKKIKQQIEIALENSAKIIAVSNSLKNEILTFGIKKEAVVINNFIDEDIYMYRSPKSKKDKFTFLSVGGMTYQKGIDVLLEAIKNLAYKHNIEFRIVGDGPQREEYIKLSKDYHISSRVNFIGKLDRVDVVEEFKNCDAFILPSRHESFGVVYIEALACGKPIIATKCGGAEDIVNEINGKLVDVGNVEQLEKAMLEIIDNIDSYDEEIIKNDFLKRFSKKINTKKYIDLYKEVLTCVE